MVRAKNNPRKGSIAYRPRKRAEKQTPSFHSFPQMDGTVKPLNFYGYKVGMVYLIAQSLHKGGRQEKMDIQIPSTVIECPPLHVWGVRAYQKTPYGIVALGDVSVDKVDKHALRRMPSFKKKAGHKKHVSPNKGEKKSMGWDELAAKKDAIVSIRLLVHTQPSKTNIGKKIPDIAEVALSGSMEEQLAFAKEKLGKEISIKETFKDSQDIDVKAVTRGFGFGGVVARFGVKIQRPKAKTGRVVGSISPWHPSTVMYTVARPGQLGYHNRTEFNKRIIHIESDATKINPKEGFEHYGVIQNDYLILAGSVPGPVKRVIGLRECIRPAATDHLKIGPIKRVSSTGSAF